LMKTLNVIRNSFWKKKLNILIDFSKKNNKLVKSLLKQNFITGFETVPSKNTCKSYILVYLRYSTEFSPAIENLSIRRKHEFIKQKTNKKLNKTFDENRNLFVKKLTISSNKSKLVTAFFN